MRIFLAIEIPKHALQKIELVQNKMKKGIPYGVIWIAPRAMHVTLKFIGESDASTTEKLNTRLFPVCGKEGPLQISLKGMGCFPTNKNPRVLWMGIECSKKLHNLATDLERVCVDLGIPADNRVYSPHLTLGRINSSTSMSTRSFIMGFIESIKDETIAKWESTEVTLYKSILTPAGAVYTQIMKFGLGK